MAESRGRPNRAGGSQRRSADRAAAARCCPWAARRRNDAPARIGCVPAGIRRCRGGGFHPRHAGQLGRRTEHRPSAEVAQGVAGLHVVVKGIVRAPDQFWGVESFVGHDAAGKTIALSVYGRDASDARMLAKLWRFCFYRDSGPTLIVDRIQQVEHEAYLTSMAAGRCGGPRGARRWPVRAKQGRGDRQQAPQ